MDTRTKLIEVAIMFILCGLALFNMPDNTQSKGRKTFCGIICSALFLYTIYFVGKIYLADHFTFAGEWRFTKERIIDFVIYNIKYIAALILTFVGVVAWLEYTDKGNEKPKRDPEKPPDGFIPREDLTIYAHCPYSGEQENVHFIYCYDGIYRFNGCKTWHPTDACRKCSQECVTKLKNIHTDYFIDGLH